jgi:hypothetical protein
MNRAKWTIKGGINNGVTIELVTPEEFKNLPKGTRLWNIFGDLLIKGKDEIDGDTRGGFMAVGIRNDI